MDSMYETLMSMPLFAGVSRHRMSEIIGKYKFHFLKFNPGETIATEGEMCTHLKSVIAGNVRVTVKNKDQHFQVAQTLSAPDLIAPEFFFGKTTTYPATVEAIGHAGILQLDKTDFLNIINSDPIFLFNYLNILSVNAQRSIEGVLALTSGTLEKRIAYWIVALTQTNGKDIVLQCRQRDMYTVFGVPRQPLISALDHMTQAGIITYTPREITVLNRRALSAILAD